MSTSELSPKLKRSRSFFLKLVLQEYNVKNLGVLPGGTSGSTGGVCCSQLCHLSAAKPLKKQVKNIAHILPKIKESKPGI
jgi:hypothetical protein